MKHPTWVVSLAVAGLVIGVRELGGLQPWELSSYDQMVRLQHERSPDPRLLIVAITEDDIRAQNRWPISDSVIAQLIQRLQQYQPRTIGVDIYRDVPHAPGNPTLLKQLQAPNVFSITLLGDEEKEGVPPPPSVSQQKVGLSDIVVDPDGIVRRAFLYATSQEQEFYAFSLRLGLHYLAHENPNKRFPFQVRSGEAIQIGDVSLPSLTENSAGYENLDDRGYQIILSYRAAKNIARQVTLTQVLEGKIDPAWVQDKLVIIGTTARSARDFFFTPYNYSIEKNPEVPGVMLHGQQVSQVLSTVLDGEPLIWYWPNPVEYFWIFSWAFVAGLLGWRLRHPIPLGIVGATGLSGLFGICYLLFLQSGWVPFVPAAIAFLASEVVIIAYRLLYDSLHDNLTGLPNRTLFTNQLQNALKQRKKADAAKSTTEAEASLAVVFLGLDSFKSINDTFGHRWADKLLVSVSQRLQSCLRASDELARVGGDEFAILLRNVRDPDEVGHLANHLQKQVKVPFHLDGQEVVTTASLGIVLDQFDTNYQPEEILRDAHTAMNQAKSSGKAQYQVFISGMRAQVVNRLHMEADLRHAIARQELLLYYQPLIHLATGRIAGFEALIRWNHPQRGFVHPVEFIPIAEESDLILPIGQWVIGEACRQLKIWQTQFTFDEPLLVSVNLSGKQFSQADLVEQIEQVLQETGIDGHSLKLEITESIAMTEVESTIALLMRLKALNLQLSIDDFGTGYSSLSYLHRFPTDTIKVDRSFVSRMGDQSEDAQIVQTIVMLGHNLKMNIVAEGVETAEQLMRLRELQCEYAQGYFFSRPVPSDVAEILLRSNPQW